MGRRKKTRVSVAQLLIVAIEDQVAIRRLWFTMLIAALLICAVLWCVGLAVVNVLNSIQLETLLADAVRLVAQATGHQ